MASVSQLVTAIATVTQIEEKTVNAYARVLIDAGVLPKSSGKSIAQVTPEHCGWLMLAIAVQPVIRVTPDFIKLYGDMISRTAGNPNLLDVIAKLFAAASTGGEDIERRWNAVKLRISKNRLGASLTLPDGKFVEFRPPWKADVSATEKVKVEPNPFFSSFVEVPFCSFVFICQIAKAFQQVATKSSIEPISLIERIQPDA